MRIFLLPLFVLLIASVCLAQRNPTMTSQLDDSNREQLYARFSENKKVAVAERQKLAYEAACDYVKRYSGEQDSHLAEMRRFVNEYERVMGNFEVHEAFAAGKYAKAFELGRAALKKSPENFYVLATLTQAGYANSLKGDSSLNEEAIDAYARAIALSTKPEQQNGRTKMLTQLTQLYKNFHNGSEAGLEELIAAVLAKPLPE